MPDDRLTPTAGTLQMLAELRERGALVIGPGRNPSTGGPPIAGRPGGPGVAVQIGRPGAVLVTGYGRDADAAVTDALRKLPAGEPSPGAVNRRMERITARR
jgi:hypothetical protein